MVNKKNKSSNYQTKKYTPKRKYSGSNNNNKGRKGVGFLIAFLIVFLITIIINRKYFNSFFDKNSGFFSKFKITQNNLSNDLQKSTTETEQNNIKTRDAIIYFTLIKDDDLILKPVKRTIHYINNPLEATLKSLMKGITDEEDNANIVTNIPDGTELKSISIKDGIAYLDFSNEFEQNLYGRESVVNQLKQIVYTTTEFPNIKGVQFLINGEIKNYLGGDGIMIDKTLTRSDF